MKRTLLSLLMAFVLLLAACGSRSPNTSSPEKEPSVPEKVSTQENEKQEAFSSEKGEVSSASSQETQEPSEQEPAAGQLSIAAPKGPTSMGMAQLMNNYAEGGLYHFTLVGSPDELVSGIVQGEYDIAAVPVNLAANLYQKTEGNIQLAAVNTLGVLYIVESGDTVHSVTDLKGRTIYATGKGSTPEYVLNYILRENGLTPGEDVTIEYKTEHAELSSLLAAGKADLALLPQPYVASAMTGNPDLRVALDMTEEWDKTEQGQLTMGCLVVQKKLAEESPELLDNFLREYRDSVNFIKDEENLEISSQMIEHFHILKADIAKQALPQCSLTFVRGDKMKEMTEGFLQVLYEFDPKSIGGEMPDDHFYYGITQP